ncbi:DUF87 domain-containing protein, partial [Methanococcoides sp. SA1]|nr:DUF87 domain-containing protein [Methanococcoides sp. SA1]
ETLNIFSTVPVSKTWTISTNTIEETKAVDSFGDLQAVVISNTGNTNMTWNLASTNVSLVGVNVSSLEVPLGENRSFMTNYTAPSEGGNYIAVVTVTNVDGSASPVQENVSVNITATVLEAAIVYPTSSNVLSGVEGQDNITISCNATYEDTNITNESSWNVSVGGEDCLNDSYSYNETFNTWNISCLAPNLTDGVTYNVTAVLTHDTYGEVDSTNSDAVGYLDLTAPAFEFVRNNVNLGDNISIQVNVSDNVGVSDTNATLYYPNSSNVSLELTSSGGYYVNTTLVSAVAGEYTINVSAVDATGNSNSSSDWFEVQNNYTWELNLSDYEGSAVNGSLVSLFRPNTSLVLNNGTSDVNGSLDLNINQRFYDLFVNFSGDSVRVKNINFTNWTTSNISFNGHRMDGEDLSEIVTLYDPFMGIAVNASGMSSNPAELSFAYYGLGYGYDDSAELGIVKCADWNYSDRSCDGSWSVLTSVRDVDAKRINANSTGFSAYFLAENKCGNGACETTYGETTSTCSTDCVVAPATPTGGGGGGGGGGSSSASVDLEGIERLIESILDVGGTVVETTSIEKSLFPGDVTTAKIRLKNTLDKSTSTQLSAVGDASSFIFFESKDVVLEAGESKDVVMKIIAPQSAKVGEYGGDLVINSGEEEGKIGVNIKILSPEGKLLDVKIQPLVQTIAPGEVLRLQADLLNLGKSKIVDVQFDLQLIDLDSGEIVTRAEEAFAVETSISTIKNLTIPDYIEPARYMIKAVAYYSNVELEGTMQASSIAYINVQHPFFERKLFGFYLWMYLLALLFVGVGVLGYYYFRWFERKNKRFKSKLDLSKLPRDSSHSGYVGRVAETDEKTYVDLNKLQMHTLIAGSTGSGKTVAAQDIVEEALIKKKSVIVFDPTAQWTGFLRKCTDPGMLKRYKYFDMKRKEARAFDGSVKTIRDPYEIIDIKKHMNKEGEIMIFDVSRLSPKEIDIVVASTIEQIFRSSPEGSKELKTLIVYDEVHRLLPKFGGSGKGFVQIERGAREFRKWGIGLVLISQVLSDFVGEIKANIGTEVQMGTRYEGDLKRVSLKYGDDILKSVAKEPIGTGMVLNAEYNNGIPYFVAFRPMLHSTKELTKTELNKYEKYFNEAEDLDYQIAELKKLSSRDDPAGPKIDTTDVELELKLARGKIKMGKFTMAETYLETLRPKFVQAWKNAGVAPMHIVRKKLKAEAVVAGVTEAKRGRTEFAKKNPVKEVSFDEEIAKLDDEVEERKKKGIDTSTVEISLTALKDKLEPFEGRVPEGSSKNIKAEILKVRDELKKLDSGVKGGKAK